MPKVSIIVPVYNVEQYLYRCIESILLQSFEDIEILLIDDGSTDRCSRICDEYAEKDNRIIVVHQKNAGVSDARNVGLDIANGSYIAFCDADDYLDKDYIKTLYYHMESKKTDLITAGITVINEIEQYLNSFEHADEIYLLNTLSERLDFIINHVLLFDIGWEVWTKLFKRSVIKDNDIRFCKTCENFAEDMSFVLEYLLYCNSVAVCSSIGYYYTKRMNSMMDKSRELIRLNSMNEVSKHFGQRYLGIQDSNKKYFSIVHFLILWNQYKKIVLTERYSGLSEEIKKIADKKWFKKWTRAIFFSKSVFYELFGKSTTQQIMLLSSYCLHGSWTIHSYCSAIFYHIIYKNEEGKIINTKK